ncbi:MAG: hypothetical protein WD042_16005 [Phycisphaeraceae bacterium]
MTKEYHQWLLELTGTPTASGREQRVIAWVRRWVSKRKHLAISADRFGNLTIKRRGARSARPIYITAHMDHPAFVVSRVIGPREVEAEFRGGVADEYFAGSPVVLHHADLPPQRGVVAELVKARDEEGSQVVIVRSEGEAPAAVGDVMTWDVGPARIEGDRLVAPGCDDLAGVVGALAGLAAVTDRKKGAPNRKRQSDVRVMLTRAEEGGFIGAIAACRAKLIPAKARLVLLENSRSFADSPIGGGPIVRVGDRTSTFDPDLTYRLSSIAGDLAKADPSFKWQRKLMPGGTCESSVYQAYGYTSACLCLPLGNYHNQNFDTGKIDAETISLTDFDGLVRLVVEAAMKLDDSQHAPSLRTRLEALYKRNRHMLAE